MSKDKSLIVSRESIIKKCINFFKNIFSRKNKAEEDIKIQYQVDEKKKEKFINSLQESTNAEKIIEKVMQDKSVLYSMSVEQLKELNNAIKTKQDILEQRVVELKAQIANLM